MPTGMFRQPSAPQKNGMLSYPPPISGYDPSSAFMEMKPQTAVILENFFPRANGIETRDGFVNHATGIPVQPHRLHVYSAPTGGEALFTTTDQGCYDVTSAGAVGAAAFVLTNGKTISTAINTGVTNYLTMVNGVDDLHRYDGSAWATVPTFGTAPVRNTHDYSYVELYRQRLFFAVRSSTQIEYLPSNSIAGQQVNYDLGALFRLGGFIIALAVWTIDGGVGPEDNLCVITNKGEVAVFAGNDPTTWSLRGVYFVGRPLGLTPGFKYGGDILWLTETGIVPMSSVIQTASLDRTATVTTTIRQNTVDNAQQFFSNEGWQIISDPIKPFLLMNIPSTPLRKQAVMNSQTGAWCTYVGWNAIHFARKNGELYFIDSTGTAGTWKINRVTGFADAGTNITATMLQAYSTFGYSGEKKIEEVRPYFNAATPFQYNAGVSNDFLDAAEYTQQQVGSGISAGVWGLGVWGTSVWTGTSLVANDWITVPDAYGNWKALYIQTVSRLSKVQYIGSDILMKRGGHF